MMVLVLRSVRTFEDFSDFSFIELSSSLVYASSFLQVSELFHGRSDFSIRVSNQGVYGAVHGLELF